MALYEGRSSQARQLPKRERERERERERAVQIFGAKVRKILLHKVYFRKDIFLKNAGREAHSLFDNFATYSLRKKS